MATITPTPLPAPRNLEDEYRLYLHALRQAARAVLGAEAVTHCDAEAVTKTPPASTPPGP